MIRTPTRPVALRGTIFRGSDQVRLGLLTPAALRSSAWRRIFPDIYACSSVVVTHRHRAIAAARLLLPGAVVSGRSAAELWDVVLTEPGDDVELTVARSCRAGAVRGIRLTRRGLSESDVVLRAGVRVTSLVRTALDLARIQPPDEAVVAVDQFLHAGLVPIAEVRAAAAAMTGPGCRDIRRVLERADGLAGSPQETRLRLLIHGSHLPRPIAQYKVRQDGRFVADVDFGWPEHKVAVEYDGVWHGEPQQVGKDRRRLNRLTAAGWTVIFVTAADLRDPDGVIARIAAALKAPLYV